MANCHCQQFCDHCSFVGINCVCRTKIQVVSLTSQVNLLKRSEQYLRTCQQVEVVFYLANEKLNFFCISQWVFIHLPTFPKSQSSGTFPAKHSEQTRSSILVFKVTSHFKLPQTKELSWLVKLSVRCVVIICLKKPFPKIEAMDSALELILIRIWRLIIWRL